MADDIEAQGELTDKVAQSRTTADRIEADSLRQKRKFKEGKSYVSEDVAEQARESVASYNRDLESVESTLEGAPANTNAPLVRSTPGPDDAPAFSAGEKSATDESEDKLVVEEPDVLQGETIVGAPSSLETGVLGEPKPNGDEDEPEHDSAEDDVEGKDIDLADAPGQHPGDTGTTEDLKPSDEEVDVKPVEPAADHPNVDTTETGAKKSGDDLKPDKPAKKTTAKKAANK